MSPNAVYSKSGKGVQEAGGKTALLGRGERAVLTAIDGRATLGQVAQKVGKAFDGDFKQLIRQLDSDGFIREVSAGGPAKPGKAAAKADEASDLDFTASIPVPERSGSAAPPPAAGQQATAERIAREQQSAFARAREEAERKQAEGRERQKAEAEARLRAETEARIRVEAEQKARAHGETEQQRIRALTEDKARAETEAKVAAAAREAAVREAARLAGEAKAKAEAEAGELRRRLDEERKAREAAERKAREDAERALRDAEEKVRREAEQMRRQLDEERRRMQEEHKRREEAQLGQRLENEQRERALLDARRRAEQDEQEAEKIRQTLQARQGKRAAPPPQQPPTTTGDAFADSLMQDLEAFNHQDEEQERKRRADYAALEAMQAMQRQEAEIKGKEDAERRGREDAERERREAEERRRREEKERRAREEQEAARAEREAQDAMAREEERRRDEEERRKRKAKEEEKLAARAGGGSGYSASAEAKRKQALMQSAARARERRESHLGRTIALTLFLVLALGAAAAYFVPLPKADYEIAASNTLGRPVKIAAARFSLVPTPHLRLEGVTVADRATIAAVRAFPELEKLLGGSISFRRLELEGASLRQEALGEALFAKPKPAGMSVTRIQARDLKLPGPVPLAPLNIEAVIGADGAVRSATVRGADGLVATLVARSAAIEFDVSATRFTLPFAPDLTLGQFAMKGSATRNAMNVTAWDGTLYNGTVSGTASLRWGGTWNVEGAIRARGINAGVFAPALLADGRAEGNGRFWMSGTEPAKLGRAGRVEGSFTVLKGVLGGVDLSLAIQTGGREFTGSTRFSEMNGHAVYDQGSVALRNVTIGAGALNAGASADITQGGALSGRIVADVRTPSQAMRATLLLGGTVKEPQVRN